MRCSSAWNHASIDIDIIQHGAAAVSDSANDKHNNTRRCKQISDSYLETSSA